jgi:putative nucleotidyltransferase with HDIG domain
MSMDQMTLDREKAILMIRLYVKSLSLQRHMLAVEAAMRFYARINTQNEDLWGLTGLLHDFDWEIHPDSATHPKKGAEILRDECFPEEIIQAILTHGDDPDFPRSALLQKYLFACDEITGFITAVALIRPSHSLSDLSAASIKKKWKDKAFAAAVDRASIEEGARSIGIDLWIHVENVIQAMQSISTQLGL